MTFKHKLLVRLALGRRVLPLATVLLLSCEFRRSVTGVDIALSRFELFPADASLQPQQMVDFTVIGVDEHGDTVTVGVLWSVTAGSIVDTSTNNRRQYARYRAGPDTGPVRVIARSRGGSLSDTATVLVTLASVASVSVSPPAASLAVGGAVQLAAVVRDSAGNLLAGRSISWSSSAPGVATVSPTGLVTGAAGGSATITATSTGRSGTSAITVTAPPPPTPVASVALSPATAGVAVGGTVQLQATPRDAAGNALTGRVVSWASGNTAIATVSSTGLVRGVAAGSATLTATSEGRSGMAAITVTTPPPLPPGGLPVFPGAEGHGTTTPAGRGGTVLPVTNLNDGGEGSLRAAMEATGPRVVIFEISGTIDLASYLVIRNPFITVAGQTAPSPGITLRGAGITINTHDVLVQHIRIRPGDASSGPSPGNRDAIQILNATNYNVVVDHVSASWAIDETMSTYYGPSNVTISNCIIAEGLSNSLHPEGEHSKGLLVGEGGYNTSVIRNLLAHNKDRNPYFKGDTYTLFVNNVAYNYGLNYAVENGDGENNGRQESTNLGNVYLPGVNTPVNRAPVRVHSSVKPGSAIFVADNTFRREPPPSDPWQLVQFQPSDQSIKASTPPEWVTPLTVLPSSLVEQTVLAGVGARPADRDAVDARIVNEVRTGAGRIIDSPAQVGGWPMLAVNQRALTLPANPWGDDDGDGYANLEEWLHQFAAQVEGR